MGLAQADTANELDDRLQCVWHIAGHPIGQVRPQAMGMPTALGVGHMTRRAARFDGLHDHDGPRYWFAQAIDNLAPEVRRQLTRRGCKGGNQKSEEEDEKFH
ncbi:hypothetical protein D7U77_13605 [Stenotrophomonas maltophilia]|nr:hypothetical protein [Stenotrophomonas maltophilia]